MRGRHLLSLVLPAVLSLGFFTAQPAASAGLSDEDLNLRLISYEDLMLLEPAVRMKYIAKLQVMLEEMAQQGPDEFFAKNQGVDRHQIAAFLRFFQSTQFTEAAFAQGTDGTRTPRVLRPPTPNGTAPRPGSPPAAQPVPAPPAGLDSTASPRPAQPEPARTQGPRSPQESSDRQVYQFVTNQFANTPAGQRYFAGLGGGQNPGGLFADVVENGRNNMVLAPNPCRQRGGGARPYCAEAWKCYCLTPNERDIAAMGFSPFWGEGQQHLRSLNQQSSPANRTRFLNSLAGRGQPMPNSTTPPAAPAPAPARPTQALPTPPAPRPEPAAAPVAPVPPVAPAAPPAEPVAPAPEAVPPVQAGDPPAPPPAAAAPPAVAVPAPQAADEEPDPAASPSPSPASTPAGPVAPTPGPSPSAAPQAQGGDACRPTLDRCEDTMPKTREEQRKARSEFLATNPESCVFAGNISTYDRTSRGYCTPPTRMTYKDASGQSQTLRCTRNQQTRKVQVLCNPMLFGLKEDGTALCVEANATASRSCREQGSVRRADEFLKKAQNAADLWNDFMGKLNKTCEPNSQSRKYFCGVCRLMFRRLHEMRREIGRLVDNGGRCEIKPDAAPAPGTRGGPVAVPVPPRRPPGLGTPGTAQPPAPGSAPGRQSQ
jgi:hypothetical protein